MYSVTAIQYNKYYLYFFFLQYLKTTRIELNAMMMTNIAANEPAIMTALPLTFTFVLLTCSQSKMDGVQCELCIMNNHNNNALYHIHT